MNLKIIQAPNPLAEAFAKSIASVESQIEIRKLSIVEELLQFMQQAGIEQSELPERMGVSPTRVKRMLSGDEDLTIDTLARAGHAVGADLVATFVATGEKGQWVAESTKSDKMV